MSIPSSVNLIGLSAFNECTSLELVSFDSPASISIIDDFAFYKCMSLEQISIPSPISVIGSNAFDECQSLLEISIASTLRKTGSKVFLPKTLIYRTPDQDIPITFNNDQYLFSYGDTGQMNIWVNKSSIY